MDLVIAALAAGAAAVALPLALRMVNAWQQVAQERAKIGQLEAMEKAERTAHMRSLALHRWEKNDGEPDDDEEAGDDGFQIPPFVVALAQGAGLDVDALRSGDPEAWTKALAMGKNALASAGGQRETTAAYL